MKPFLLCDNNVPCSIEKHCMYPCDTLSFNELYNAFFVACTKFYKVIICTYPCHHMTSCMMPLLLCENNVFAMKVVACTHHVIA